MGADKHKGFTIVEVMLVLGITGVVMAFMLIGLSTQLNRHRYQDATSSLIGYMQSQYELVANVNNSRESIDANLSGCSTDGDVAGTSECTIVGRVIHAGTLSDSDVTVINAGWVVAKTAIATLPSGLTGKEVLQQSQLTEPSSEESYTVRWGTRLVRAADHSRPLSFSMLIVRMPTTGVVSTYVNPGVNVAPDAIVHAGDNLDTDFKMCIDPVGLLGAVNEPVGVMIKRGAANSSGVQQLDQGECV